MTPELDRRTFLRASLLTALGYGLVGCGTRTAAPQANDALHADAAACVPVSTDGLLLFGRGDQRYEELRGGFNKRIQKQPLVIALCRTVAEVATAVRYARQQDLALAVRSGGHSFEGFSSNDGGMVLDLSLMDHLEWRDDKGAIRVGPALTLARLYDHLLPHGRILPAGSCGSVALGGLTLGGGYGLFSRRLGLTCDSLQELTLVDGTGEVRSTREDPELLWACRGGGNGNFGVVTSLTFRTSPAPSGLFSHRFKAYKLQPQRASRLLEAWCAQAARLPLTSFSAFVLNGQSLTILVTDTENREPALHGVLQELGRITDKTHIGKRQDLPSALQRYYGIDHPLYFKNASAGFYDGWNDIAGVSEALAALVGSQSGMIFQVNTLGGNIDHPELARRSAFAHRSCPFLAELQAYYEHPRQAAPLLATFRQVQALLAGNGVRRHYRNYPDLDFHDWAQAYYGGSYARLQAVKRRYDPEDAFGYPQGVRL